MNENKYKPLEQGDLAKIFLKLDAVMRVKRDVDKEIITLQKERLKPWVDMAKYKSQKGVKN